MNALVNRPQYSAPALSFVATRKEPEIYFDLSRLPFATEAKIISDHQYQLETKGFSYWSLSPAERIAKGWELLQIASDAKTYKGESLGVDTGIVYLLPATHAAPKGQTLCSHAALAKCIKPCLVTAGRGRMTSVHNARAYKTLFWFASPEEYKETLDAEVKRYSARAQQQGRVFAIRPNGTSDVDASWLAERNPQTPVYDYTKVFSRLGNTPENYHLTFSYSGADPDYKAQGFEALNRGFNVAVVFDKKTKAEALEQGWFGYQCFDADETDARFLDPRAPQGWHVKGYVATLSAKGNAKTDYSGFTQYNLQGITPKAPAAEPKSKVSGGWSVVSINTL